MVNKCKNKIKALQRSKWKAQNLSEEENEKRLKKVCDRYKNLSEEEKEKNHQYHCDQNKIIFLKKKNKKSWIYEKLLFRT